MKLLTILSFLCLLSCASPRVQPSLLGISPIKEVRSSQGLFSIVLQDNSEILIEAEPGKAVYYFAIGDKEYGFTAFQKEGFAYALIELDVFLISEK